VVDFSVVRRMLSYLAHFIRNKEPRRPNCWPDPVCAGRWSARRRGSRLIASMDRNQIDRRAAGICGLGQTIAVQLDASGI